MTPRPNPETLRWVLLQTAPWGHRMRLPGWHLARHLVLRGHPLAYVSAPVSPWHFLSGPGRELAARRWNQDGARGRWRAPNLLTYIPRTLVPINRSGPFDTEFSWRLSHALTVPCAAGVLADEGFAAPDVVVLQCPLLFGLAKSLRPRVAVFALEDALEHFSGMPRVAIRHARDMTAWADFTTVTATGLERWARREGAKSILHLPNGVAFRRFARPNPLPPAPPEMAPNGPIAIYVGALDEWFDEALLASVARALPGWRFVLVGPPRLPFAALRALPNVAFLGPRPPQEVPPHLWHATVGIIPFRRTPLIETVQPLKLYEYLAAGLPVVATPWRELEELRARMDPAVPLALAPRASEFAAALRAAAVLPRANAGVAFARRHSWDAIFPRLEAEVRRRLK